MEKESGLRVPSSAWGAGESNPSGIRARIRSNGKGIMVTGTQISLGGAKSKVARTKSVGWSKRRGLAAKALPLTERLAGVGVELWALARLFPPLPNESLEIS